MKRFFRAATRIIAVAALAMNMNTGLAAEKNQDYLQTVRLSWETMPGAVSYQVVVYDSDKDTSANIVTTKRDIFTNGYELDTTLMPGVRDYYWKVYPLDASRQIIARFNELRPMAEQELNPVAPKPMTEFDSMAYAMLYPTYSWIPAKNGGVYDVEVYRVSENGDGDELINSATTEYPVYYESKGYTWPSKYYWQVRNRNEAGTMISEWSEPVYFQVEKNARVAALGDSITHGGGAVSVSPDHVMYNWETYSEVPVKNLGYSGDTAEVLDERFERDVLPFSPEVLLIMGGVNDFRAGTSAEDIIYHLRRIGRKCRENNIIPVYMTATPINPDLIVNWSYITRPADNWLAEQKKLNEWIMAQEYAVDVTPGMTDGNGYLMKEATTDGLHPDVIGKKYMGEAVSNYLLQTFPERNFLAK